MQIWSDYLPQEEYIQLLMTSLHPMLSFAESTALQIMCAQNITSECTQFHLYTVHLYIFVHTYNSHLQFVTQRNQFVATFHVLFICFISLQSHFQWLSTIATHFDLCDHFCTVCRLIIFAINWKLFLASSCIVMQLTDVCDY